MLSNKLWFTITSDKQASLSLQEVQLYTADVNNRLMTMGLRMSTNELETSKAGSCSPVNEQGHRLVQGNTNSRSPEADNHNHAGSPTHCSTSNLQPPSLMLGTNSGTSSAAKTVSGGREMTADSDEVKVEPETIELQSPRSSLIKNGLGVDFSQVSSSPHSAELQERGSGGSNGSADVPANTAVNGQLMAVGNCLQLQSGGTSQDRQLLSPASSVRYALCHSYDRGKCCKCCKVAQEDMLPTRTHAWRHLVGWQVHLCLPVRCLHQQVNACVTVVAAIEAAWDNTCTDLTHNVVCTCVLRLVRPSEQGRRKAVLVV